MANIDQWATAVEIRDLVSKMASRIEELETALTAMMRAQQKVTEAMTVEEEQ